MKIDANISETGYKTHKKIAQWKLKNEFLKLLTVRVPFSQKMIWKGKVHIPTNRGIAHKNTFSQYIIYFYTCLK